MARAGIKSWWREKIIKKKFKIFLAIWKTRRNFTVLILFELWFQNLITQKKQLLNQQ